MERTLVASSSLTTRVAAPRLGRVGRVRVRFTKVAK
jgi:hypothetical protein